jgi:uncharacterized coiled-coil protein SlyX
MQATSTSLEGCAEPSLGVATQPISIEELRAALATQESTCAAQAAELRATYEQMGQLKQALREEKQRSIATLEAITNLESKSGRMEALLAKLDAGFLQHFVFRDKLFYGIMDLLLTKVKWDDKRTIVERIKDKRLRVEAEKFHIHTGEKVPWKTPCSPTIKVAMSLHGIFLFLGDKVFDLVRPDQALDSLVLTLAPLGVNIQTAVQTFKPRARKKGNKT